MENDIEKFLAQEFATLSHKAIPKGDKQAVWLRIQNNLRQTRIPTRENRPFWFPVFHLGKLASFTLAAVLVLGLVTGATKASESSLPGDTLYSVKKVAEKVERVLATSDEAKVKVGIKHARRRLEEVTLLVAEKKEDKIVAKALQNLQDTTEQVINSATAAPLEFRDHAANLVAQEKDVLSIMQGKVEGDMKEAVQKVITASNDSINKLKNDQTAQGEEVKGTETAGGPQTTTSAPSSTSAATIPFKPKIEDVPIQSSIQMGDVIKITKPDDSANQSPEIIAEPKNRF